MGAEPPFRHGVNDGAVRRVDQPIAAFDFDGTLSVRDSFMAFLRWRAPYARWLIGMIRLAPAGLVYVLNRDRERLKSAAVAVFLRGLSRSRLESEAEAFAEAVWSRFMRPDALETWERWGQAGAWRVIVTASPETTIAPFARRLAADQLIGTRLAFDGEDRVAGTFETPNCRAQEKVVRLRRAFGPDVRLAAAYGDSSGDIEMLQIADEAGMKVFRETPATASAAPTRPS